MAPLPLIKIGALLFKEIAKPLAAHVKRNSIEHPNIRVFTIKLGRAWETMTQRIEITLSGHRVKEIKPIADAHALTVGADLISQAFLISVAIGLATFEFWRGNQAKQVETEQKRAEKEVRQRAKEARIQHMLDQIAALDARVKELEAEKHRSWLRLDALTSSDDKAPQEAGKPKSSWLWGWLTGSSQADAQDDKVAVATVAGSTDAPSAQPLPSQAPLDPVVALPPAKATVELK